MSKVLAATLAVAGATAVSVGGVYLLGSKAAKHSLDYNSLSEFVSKYKENENIKSKFVGGEISENGVSTGKPADNIFFKTSESGTTPTPSGYLKIQHQKAECNGKPVGRFSWYWAFVKGDEGFINFNLAETIKETDGTKLKVTGVVYLLTKETDSGTNTTTGKVKHKKEVADDSNAKKWSAGDLTTKFPKKNTSLTLNGVTPTVNEYWNFFDIASGSSSPTFSDAAPIDDTCRSTMEQVKPTSYEFTWTDNSSASTTLKSGSSSVSSGGGNDIYGDSSTWWSLESKDTNIKGNGTLKA